MSAPNPLIPRLPLNCHPDYSSKLEQAAQSNPPPKPRCFGGGERSLGGDTGSIGKEESGCRLDSHLFPRSTRLSCHLAETRFERSEDWRLWHPTLPIEPRFFLSKPPKLLTIPAFSAKVYASQGGVNERSRQAPPGRQGKDSQPLSD